MSILKSSMDVSNPMCIAEDREGNLLFATGLERAQRWAPGDAATEDAGLTAPTSNSSAAGAGGGGGSIQGVYKYAVRYIDDEGIASNLSALSTLEITDQTYTTVAYTSIPVPSEARVAKRQLWRATDGQSVTYYLDAEMTGTIATTHNSTKTDTQLRTSTAMRYKTAKGWPNAMRFTPPPTHTAIVVFFADRSWWAIPSEYSGGTLITISAGGTTATGTGTLFTAHMDGMTFKSTLGNAVIDSITNATNLVLESSITAGSTAYYSIQPSSAEFDSIYFSEKGEPESVPAANKITTYADNDRITGLMPLYSALYILKRSHIYRLTTCADPRLDHDIALVAERGCLNQRTWVRAEGMAFIMDQQGVYLFDGRSTQSISGPIQNYWLDGTINLSVSKWFSAVHDARRETVMFLVALNSDTIPKHALCFNYRLQQWHVESYGASVYSATAGLLSAKPRVLGGVAGTACKFDEGNTDQGSAISFNVKYGRFELPEVEREQARSVGLRFTPTAAAQTVALQYYFDGSATAQTAEIDYPNEAGAYVAAGSSEYTFDLNRSEGWLKMGLSGGGMEGRTPANRTIEVELTGSCSQAVVFEEIRIEGVVRND